VDVDIEAFFDEVNHDRLTTRITRDIRDKRLYTYLASNLRADMVLNGQRLKRSAGVPQGGPLSSLLANLYLDPLDKELEARGLSFWRYADDLMIFVSETSPRLWVRATRVCTSEARRRGKPGCGKTHREAAPRARGRSVPCSGSAGSTGHQPGRSWHDCQYPRDTIEPIAIKQIELTTNLMRQRCQGTVIGARGLERQLSPARQHLLLASDGPWRVGNPLQVLRVITSNDQLGLVDIDSDHD